MFAAEVGRSCGELHERRARAERKKFSSSIAQTPSGMVQEKIFQAGFRDVYIAQFDGRSSGESGNLRNQRAATIGINVGGVVARLIVSAVGGRVSTIFRPYFSHAGQSLQALQQLRRMAAKAQAQQITAGDRRLQFSRSTQSDVASIIVDGT